MTAWIFIAIALFVWLCSLGVTSPTSTFQFLQKPGQYPVGLEVVDLYDLSRTDPAFPHDSSKPSAREDGRPLQTLVWYPSQRSTSKPMTVGDYVQLADTEIHFDAPHPSQNRWRTLLKASFW